ncbi:Uncharacterised protein [Streptococcus suis]|uniref:Uncharacterized protein n=1 Tax=Streptococcus suis TaxID=1307 RepID=A0A116S9U5_STRSU|nr:Uncharacterised protein [Streptococcus suis]CYY02885.1 Uncharacterised protein [Streptococcus suis]CYY11212.1 Uncharacterised protein [Streptococcus suis]
MVVDIIKSLTPDELGAVLIVLGLARETRKLIKIILDYKLANKD